MTPLKLHTMVEKAADLLESIVAEYDEGGDVHICHPTAAHQKKYPGGDNAWIMDARKFLAEKESDNG